jgi:hypothetical protein
VVVAGRGNDLSTRLARIEMRLEVDELLVGAAPTHEPEYRLVVEAWEGRHAARQYTQQR